MSAQLLNWKSLPIRHTDQTGNVGQLLEDIYGFLTSSTKYLDGSPRVIGSNTAWNWYKQTSGSTTVAIYGVPPNSTLNHRVILAGSTSSASPVMASPDAVATNVIDVSIAKNAGAFIHYTSSAPFTSGQFFGYWHWCAMFAGTYTTIDRYQIFESEDCFGISVQQVDGTNTTPFIAGAILDPDSTISQDAETDGKLYGIITGGSNIANNINFTAFSTTDFTNHSTLSTGRPHAGIFLPNSATIAAISRATGVVVGSSLPYTTRGGKFVREPIHYQLSLTPFNYLGRLRECYISRNALYGTTLFETGSQKGVFISTNSSTVQNALLLTSGSI